MTFSFFTTEKEREMIEGFIKRLESMWPILRNNEEHKKAIAMLANEKASSASEDDLNHAFRLLLANHKTSNKDGGPAWPPSPHEVLGCILSAQRERKANVKIAVPYYGPRRVAGRVCRKCNGTLTLFENVLFCEECRSVQQFEGRTRLTPHEIHSLEFTDPPNVDYDTVENEKVKALEAVSRLIEGKKK